jgi:hypothetical protein
MNQDLQHLRILSILYYVVGGLIALFSCFALIYLFMGVVFVAAPPSSGGGAPPPPGLGWFFIIFSSLATLIGWSWAAAIMVAGWHLGRCKHYLYCLVMGCSTLLFQPFGTVLGVFTIILLIRPSVKDMFENGIPSEQLRDPDEITLPSNYDEHVYRDPLSIRGEL